MDKIQTGAANNAGQNAPQADRMAASESGPIRQLASKAAGYVKSAGSAVAGLAGKARDALLGNKFARNRETVAATRLAKDKSTDRPAWASKGNSKFYAKQSNDYLSKERDAHHFFATNYAKARNRVRDAVGKSRETERMANMVRYHVRERRMIDRELRRREAEAANKAKPA